MSALGIAISYVLSIYNRNFLWVASTGFVIDWFGDSLDSTLARYRNIERPVFGFFVDHTMAAVRVTLIVLGLGMTPYVSFNIACLTLNSLPASVCPCVCTYQCYLRVQNIFL